MKKSPVLTLTFGALAALLPLPLSAQLPVDRDGDGHSDLWQIHYGIPSANGIADSDGDGVSDADEERAGTNPWSADSVFGVQDFQLSRDPRGSESARFTWPALPGKQYQFQNSGDLTAASWRDLGLPVLPALGGPATAQFNLPAGTGRGFFRAQVSDIDADRDGLTAFEEGLIGTSDLTPNSGGAGGPPDSLAAATWAETHDPGISAGPMVANLREVDVAFIRELSGAASGGADLVTATGTGAWHYLTSWRTDGVSNMVAMSTSPPLQGHHARVHLLSPPKIPGLPFFVTARITPDDAFWISCRSLALNGAFQHHGTTQWKPNVLIHAKECDVTHRMFFSQQPQGITHYHVVAALVQWNPISLNRNLRILCWHVNALTGSMALLSDTPFVSTPEPHADARLRIVNVAGSQYQVVYRKENTKLVHLALTVGDFGAASVLPEAITTYDLRGGDNGWLDPADAAAAGLTSAGYATATRTPSGGLQLSVWDRRTETGALMPHLIADDTTDTAPLSIGIGQPVPVLTDSFDGTEDAEEFMSQVMATGDFNGDGFDDAAFGAPWRNAGGPSNSGGVFVMHGAADGMKNEGYTQYWRQGTEGLGGDNTSNDLFGSALASGDFDGDGFADLAVGIPGEDIGRGAVHIIYGSVTGLSALNDVVFTYEDFGGLFGIGVNALGASLAAGDFNGDGRDDLAIGTPGEMINGQPNAGAVHVIWGSATGLTLTGDVRLNQNPGGIFTGPEYAGNGDDFGRSLSAGDFNGDGKDDLAVGVPMEDMLPWNNCGAVQVYFGGAGGFTSSNFISRAGFDGGSDIQGTPNSSDQFGWSLAAGDFNHDGEDDLAIGVPGDSVAGGWTGALHVLYGAPGGLTHTGNQMIRQAGSLPAASSLPSNAVAGEDLGWSLAAGDCNGDGFADLLVSAPGEDVVPAVADSGMFFAIPGSGAGLNVSSALAVRPDVDGLFGPVNFEAKANDKFAFSLACGDFNGDGLCDLISGIPRRDKDDNALNTGAVQFFRGSGPDLLSTTSDFTWTLKRREEVRAIVSDLSREQSGGPGAGRLYGFNEALPVVHMASSTKTMTLLLAVEAIEDGFVTLEDEVIVSDLAGNAGGSTLPLYDANGTAILDGEGKSQPFIRPGDKMPLRLLMAGMMGRSCNRSSIAIGEHVAKEVRGEAKDFLIMMNARAAELDMTTSIFGHPAGGWVTNIQDGVNLQREGVRHSLFVKFASFERYGDDPEEVLVGKDKDGLAKPSGWFDQMASLGTYPGRYTWKGGNGGSWLDDTQANDAPDQPSASWCTESRVTTARRMGRTLCAVLQQTSDGSAEAQNLMDYGYRKLFSPDLRGLREFPEGGGLAGPDGPIRVKNFALTGWEGHGVTAIIDDNEELRLNIWALNPASGQITPAGSAKRSYFLQTGSTYEPAAQVSMTEIPADDSLADFFTANLIGDRLELKAWRVEQQ